MWQKSRSCSSAGLSFAADQAGSRQGLHRKLRCQSCGKRAGPARLPAQNWSVATKICIECVKVNHLANDHAISLLDYNSQRHFNLRKALFSVMWQMSIEAACLQLGNGQLIAGKSSKKARKHHVANQCRVSKF